MDIQSTNSLFHKYKSESSSYARGVQNSFNTMGTKITESSSPLLSEGHGNDDIGSYEGKKHTATSSLPPATLTFTTLVAVFGSYVFGTAVSN